jgi:hypothetical protein
MHTLTCEVLYVKGTHSRAYLQHTGTSPKLETGEDNTPLHDLESVVLLSANQILTLGSPE